MTEPTKDYITPSGRVETSIHKVTDIHMAGVHSGDGFIARHLIVHTSDGADFELVLFADKEDDLTVRFSG